MIQMMKKRAIKKPGLKAFKEAKEVTVSGTFAQQEATDNKVVLVVCAHPDDESGVAATIAHYARLGYRVVVIFLTRGEKGGNPRVRMGEGIRSCMLLGVRRRDVHFGPFADTRVPDDYRAISYLESFYNKLKPVLIATHSLHDRHQDHVAAAKASYTAFRRAPQLLSFESVSSTAEFAPTCFIAVSEEEVEVKAKALACHQSQIRKCYSLEYEAMKALTRFRGQQAGIKWAEAFETHRFLVA